MSKRNRDRRAMNLAAKESDRTLDRLVEIDGVMLPQYPGHPDRRAARLHGTTYADGEQTKQWHLAPARVQRAEQTEAYGKGWHALWQIHPEDRPDDEVARDFHGALQTWLAENAPGLTLEACAASPAPRPHGKRLRIPGDGRSEFVGGGDDE